MHPDLVGLGGLRVDGVAVDVLELHVDGRMSKRGDTRTFTPQRDRFDLLALGGLSVERFVEVVGEAGVTAALVVANGFF